ncbi:type III toxin-antitoxin system ToxN/AbiQ family toxin [Peptoniphilaceae bacterium SGI.131]
MKLYNVSDYYIDFLKKYDNKVLMNKGKRPYLGIVFDINNCNYFVPLSSYKKSHKNKHFNKKLATKLVSEEGETLGYLFYLNMIPVPKTEIKKFDLENYKITDIKYYSLVQKELRIIKSDSKKIKSKASKLYKNWTLGINFFKDMCCNFELLEIKSKEWERNLEIER